MSVNQGIITDIHRTSTVDGPGIRTTVFTKGCALRCPWCHNPEAQSFQIENGYGRMASVAEITTVCLKDRIYYEESGGGVTLSGGEPLAQSEFSLDILKQLKSFGIHTILDTTGYPPLSVYERSLAVTDLYLFDYKVTNPSQHKTLIGCSLSTVLRTLDFLCQNGAKVILRCPMIPLLNDGEDHLKAIAQLECQYPSLEGIEILPWHTMGNCKYKKLGRAVDSMLPDKNVSQSCKDSYRTFFKQQCCHKVVVKD